MHGRQEKGSGKRNTLRIGIVLHMPLLHAHMMRGW
jgi:hypothetical protein